ncbi:MAG: shikimate kinase [Acidimicrobiia bacterium]|nr:MAG: shikimate kinase [Acidimicrobiia bacterium]
MRHIWLVGMMGSGKTTVAVLAAQILGLPFVDTDARVMESTGRTITELFAEGERVFRSAEADVIAETAEDHPAVVATGGGAILSHDNVAIMKGSGTVVLLHVDAATIAERMRPCTDRPLLDSPDAVERILADRQSIYEHASDCVVSTIGRAPDEIAMEVAACVDM